MSMTSNLEGTSTRDDCLVYNYVIDAAKTISNRIIDLVDRVCVGACVNVRRESSDVGRSNYL